MTGCQPTSNIGKLAPAFQFSQTTRRERSPNPMHFARSPTSEQTGQGTATAHGGPPAVCPRCREIHWAIALFSTVHTGNPPYSIPPYSWGPWQRGSVALGSGERLEGRSRRRPHLSAQRVHGDVGPSPYHVVNVCSRRGCRHAEAIQRVSAPSGNADHAEE